MSPSDPCRGARSAVLLLLAACAGELGPGDPPDTPDVGTATADPTTFSEATVSMGLDTPATVAAACVRRDDPTEVHLLEAAGTSSVDFRFSGLLAATDYDCTVAAIEPPGPRARVGFRTWEPPFELASADAETDPALEMTGAYTVMNVRPECLGIEQNYIAVLDPEGNNRWRYDLPTGMNIGVEVIPDGPNRFLWGGGKDVVGAPAVVDVLDGQVWQLGSGAPSDIVYHHDVNRLDDGRVLSVEETYDDGWEASQLRLVDESGETSWLWDTRDGVSEGWLEPGSAANDDPHHLNWADVVETDDGLVAYASLCYLYQIVAVDVATSRLLWKFGIGGDFSLVDPGGNPLGDGEYPECQHGVQMDGTHLLVYDNGQNRGFTRSVEYTLDTEAMVATKTWEWLDEGYWEKYHGGMDWLTPDHERVLVAQGNNDCGDTSDRHSQIVEVERSTNTVVHRLVLRDISHWIYRAHRVDGCEVFANAKYCPALADRLEELAPLLDL